jgi:hypothetical protein
MNQTDPTPYSELNQVLQELVASVQAILGDNFVGTYLQGSFAVGDFDEHSDVDWVIVTKAALTEAQVAALQVMHERIYHLETEWAKHLEGSYFPQAILRHHANRGKKIWYLDHGARSLIESDHCNTIVVRWVVREKGMTLAGPPPDTLVEPISADLLRSDIFAVITEWGQEILADPDRYDNRFYQGFIVLSYCRMLHDLHTGENRSKQAGAEWAKRNLDPVWVGLIDRSWSCRPNPAVSVRTPADPADFAATLKFVQTIIDESKKLRAKGW